MKITPDLPLGEALPRLTMHDAIDDSERSASTAGNGSIIPPIDPLPASWASPPPLLNRTFSGAVATYRIRFKPSPRKLSPAAGPVALLEKLRGMGECGVAPHHERVPSCEGIDREDGQVCWDITLTTRQSVDAVRNVFASTQSEGEMDIRIIDGIIGLEESDGEAS